jgi:hypothetical protein
MEAVRRSGINDLSLVAASGFDDGMDTDLRAILKGELEPGERLLWAARSEPSPASIGAGYFWWGGIALFLLVLGIWAINYAWQARRFAENSGFGIGLGLVGVACFIGMVSIANWRTRKRAFRRKANFLYAVTDRRAIAWTPEPKGDAIRIRTLEGGQIHNLERVQRPDGSGDLFFSTGSREVPLEDFAWNPFGFTDIHGVRRVEQIVRNNLVSIEKMT